MNPYQLHFNLYFRYGEKQGRRNSQAAQLTPIQLLSATAYQLKKPYQQLLIPITVWIGMEQAFIGADFTQAYVSCALGIPSVGYVMICFGCVNAVCSLLFGSIMKYIGMLRQTGAHYKNKSNIHKCDATIGR